MHRLVKMNERRSVVPTEVVLYFEDEAGKQIDITLSAQDFINVAPRLAQQAVGMLHRAKTGPLEKLGDREEMAICSPAKFNVDTDQLMVPPQVLLIFDQGESEQLCLSLDALTARKFAERITKAAESLDSSAPTPYGSGTAH